MRVELVRNMSEAIYHSDPCDTPSLSQSIATCLLQHSPAHAYLAHPKLGNGAKPSTADQIMGQLHHSLLLDRHASTEWEPIDARDSKGEPATGFLTNDAKAMKADAIARGKKPILLGKFEEAIREADIIAGKLRDAGCNLWNEGAEHEVSCFWVEDRPINIDGKVYALEDAPGFGVQCRGRLDYLSIGDRLIDIVDVKCISNASEEKVARVIKDNDYALQQVAYVRALQAICGAEKPVRFRFAFYEPEPPYAVNIVSLSESWIEYGTKRWLRARDIWARCLASGEWPSFGATVSHCPAWAMAAEGVGEL